MPREAIWRAADRSAHSTAYPGGRLRELAHDWLQIWPPDYADSAASQHIEQTIANARVLLAIAVLLAALLDPDAPARFQPLVHVLSAAYLVYSIGALYAVRSKLSSTPWIRTYQTIDLIFPVALIVLTTGPRSQYLVLLAFAILFSSMRGSMANSIICGAIAALVLVGTAAIAYLQAWPSQYWPPHIDAGLFLLDATYVAITPLLIGYLAEGRRRLYAEQVMVGTFLRLFRSEPALGTGLFRVFDELSRYFPAREFLFVVQDGGRQRAWLWRFTPADVPRGSGAGHIQSVRLETAEWPVYFGPRTAPSWQQRVEASDPFFARHPCGYLLGCDTAIGTDFYLRLMILDPGDAPLPRRRLRLLQNIVAQLGPPLLSEYLLARLKSRAQEEGRNRLARELHDGVTQSLLGLELEVESYRRKLPESDENARRFQSIRDQLHDSILDLRALMGELRTAGITRDSLPVAIRQSAARLTRETGLPVKLEGLDALKTPNERSAREIVQFVHEALINVRKHASATHVAIVYREQGHCGSLAVIDDGRGFDFDGTLQGRELERYDHLPIMLFARASTLGATLALHSRVGKGASVELTWPLESTSRVAAPGRGP